MLALILSVIAFVLAVILPQDLVVLITPIIVWLASGAVNWLKAHLTGEEGGFGGLVFTAILVPALSIVATLVMNELVKTDISFILQIVLGTVGVFINEVIKQIKQSKDGTQTKVNKSIV